MENMYNVSMALWIGSVAWFIFLLLVDLFFSKDQKKDVGMKSALIRSGIWIGLGIGFGVFVWTILGHEAGSQYFAGFIVEKSLSIDNIFVWSALLAYVGIPNSAKYMTLFWGILGAIVFRILFLLVGVIVLDAFQFMLFFLGLILLFTAYKIFSDKGSGFSGKDSKSIGLIRKIIPFSDKMNGNKFFVKERGKSVPSLLFFAVTCLAVTDILFAIDSVPTVLAVARNPFVAMTSNVAAVLGLRALFFVFENLKQSFWLLNKGLGLLLAVIGVTLLLEPKVLFGLDWFGYEPPTPPLLLFIFSILFLSIVGSIVFPKKLPTYKDK